MLFSSCAAPPLLLYSQQIERPMLQKLRQLPIPDCSIKINGNENVLMAAYLPLSATSSSLML